MSQDALVELLSRLSRRTEQDEVAWQEEPSSSDAFIAGFGNYTVEISHDRNSYLGTDDYYLRIYDSENELIEEASDTELQSMVKADIRTMMKTLHVRARRIARGADQAVQAILEAL